MFRVYVQRFSKDGYDMRLGDICIDSRLQSLLVGVSRAGMIKLFYDEGETYPTYQKNWERKLSIEYKDWFYLV